MFREGNQDAIDLLYERYNRFLYGIINELLKNCSMNYEYDEFYQDAVVIFINCIERYDEENGCFYFFVRKCIERKIFDNLNKIKRRSRILSLDNYKYDNCEDRYIDYIAEEDNFRYLEYENLTEGLDELNKMIVDLKIEGYSYREISKMLRISKQGIYRRIEKIKNILKDVIEKID